jgi:Na+-driven multidrug efflux pump
MEPVLLALGQEAQLSKDVQSFLRVLIVGAPAYIGFETVKKFLQCQGKDRVIAFSIDVSPLPQASCRLRRWS